MREHTVNDLEFDLSLLDRLEAEGMSQVALATELGLSEGHLSRRLARARQIRREIDRRRLATDEPDDRLDPFDYPYMELVDRDPTGWYSLESDRASRSGGQVHIGGRVQALDGGQLNGEIGGPTQYRPDPKLKGGIG